MKFIIFVAILLLGFVAFSNALSDEEEWTNFKQKWNKNYGPEEDSERFEYFKAALKRINEGNEREIKAGNSVRYGLNIHSDKSPKEWESMFGLKKPEKNH